MSIACLDLYVSNYLMNKPHTLCPQFESIILFILDGTHFLKQIFVFYLSSRDNLI